MLNLILLNLFILIASPVFAQQYCRDIFNTRSQNSTTLKNIYHKHGDMLAYKNYGPQTRPVNSRLRISTYNMKNFLNLKKHPDANTPQELERRKAQAELIREINPDFQILTEAESASAINQLVKLHLDKKYTTLMIPGNTASHNIALLVKKDLRTEVHWKSYRYYMNDPNTHKKVFTRDLPVGVVHNLNYRNNASRKPQFIIIGTHYKSKIKSGEAFDLTPEIRQQEIEATLDIVRENQTLYGEDVPIILTGDFNTNLMERSDLQPLFDFGFQDSFNMSPDKIPEHRRYTHHSFDKEGEPIFSQIDAVLIYQNKPALKVKLAKVVGHRNEEGNTFVLPENMQQRNERPSDHLGVLSVIEPL